MKENTKNTIAAYSIKHAFVGLGLKEADVATLRYLNYFAKYVPVAAADFLHVLPKQNLLNDLYEKDTQMLISNYTIDEDRKNQMKEEVKSSLTNCNETLIKYDVKEGDALEEMVKSSQEINADLIVIGQNPASKEQRILAKYLVRSNTSNTLIIPQKAKTSISTILVPIDFSETSDRAFKAAIALHQRLELPTRIICLHVYSMPNNNYFRNETPWLALKDEVESSLNKGFNAFIQNNAGNYPHKIEVALVERETTGTATYISNFAKKEMVDFVVIGARGHSKAHLLLMGSVTEGVLDLNYNIPTLITR